MSLRSDFHIGIYIHGMKGTKPPYPTSYDELVRAPPSCWSRHCSTTWLEAGEEHTQDGNVTAFRRWGLFPRILAGAADRDLSIELFGQQYLSPIFVAPIGVVGIMHPEQHGDLEVARAAAATGVPGMISTLTQDPMEDVAAEFGDTVASDCA